MRFPYGTLFAILLTVTAGAAPPAWDLYNAAAVIPAAVQNIAQGSRFVLSMPGTGIGPKKAVAAGFPLPTDAGLAGITVQVNVGGPQAYQCPIVYAGFETVIAILPSNTPLGQGQITLYYTDPNGTVVGGPNPPVNVVPIGFGIYSQSGFGVGPAIVYDSNGNSIDITNPAHNGDTVSLRGTGLGAITGDETVPPPMTEMNTGAQVFVGNQPATIVFDGRAGGGPGNDRIDFVVPDGVSGCYVSLEVNVGGVASNFVSMPVMGPNDTACADPSLGFSGSDLQPNAAGGLNTGEIDLISVVGEQGDANFNQLDLPTLTALLGPGVGSFVPSIGSCVVVATHGITPSLPTATGNGLDAGPQLNVKSVANGSQPIAAVSPGAYTAKLSHSGKNGGTPTPSFLFPGIYTVDNGSGGKDVGPFSTSITIPQPVTWTNQPAQFAVVPRAQPFLITWTGGSPNDVAIVYGVSISTTVPNGLTAQFLCSAHASDSQFTIPADVMSWLPATPIPATTPSAGITVGSFSSAKFSANGLDLGYIWSMVTAGQYVAFQ